MSNECIDRTLHAFKPSKGFRCSFILAKHCIGSRYSNNVIHNNHKITRMSNSARWAFTTCTKIMALDVNTRRIWYIFRNLMDYSCIKFALLYHIPPNFNAHHCYACYSIFVNEKMHPVLSQRQMQMSGLQFLLLLRLTVIRVLGHAIRKFPWNIWQNSIFAETAYIPVTWVTFFFSFSKTTCHLCPLISLQNQIDYNRSESRQQKMSKSNIK